MTSHMQDVQHQSIMSVLVEREECNLFAFLKPMLAQDGDQWCVLLGENLQTGVSAFGNTPYEAILAFNKAMHQPAKTYKRKKL